MKRLLLLSLTIATLYGCSKESTPEPYTPPTSSNSGTNNNNSGGCTCGAMTLDGDPCKRAVVCGSGYCWQHD